MKRFLNYFFCTLGVLFFVLLCGLAYLWFADPFEIRPLIASFSTASTAPASTQSEPASAPLGEEESPIDKNALLNPSQESALESIGIDPAKLPDTITPEMTACFTRILGSERVAAIVAGAKPTPLEIMQTRECYAQ